MIFLLCSILFIAGCAVAFRFSADRGCKPIGVNFAFRLCSGVIGTTVMVVSLRDEGFSGIPLAVWGWAFVGGVFFWSAGYANLRASGLGHLGITWSVTRCAMVMAVIASVVAWHEIPLSVDSAALWVTAAGVLLTGAALILFGIDRLHAGQNNRKQHGSRLWATWLAGAFLLQGGWEVSLRAAGSFEADRYRAVYIGTVFFTAMVLSAATLFAKRIRMGRGEWLYGGLAGVCSVLGSGLRPYAVRELPGVFVFPVTAVGIMLLTQAASAMIWKSRLGRWGWLGVLAAGAAVFLLAGVR